MSESFEFESLDEIRGGAIGPKGQRVFYLQVRNNRTVITFKAEKQQISALAEYLDRILVDLPPTADSASLVAAPVEEPGRHEWAIGSIGIAYDEAADRIVIVAEELVPDAEGADAKGNDGAARAKLPITRTQARLFVAQAREAVAAGRPLCPFCGRPLDPVAGLCPCYN